MALPRGLRTAVLVAHPGHELVIHAFVERFHPIVAVWTDGSGTTGLSRVPSTSRLLDDAGAAPGPVYGEVTDQQCYAALLARDIPFFTAMVERVSRFLEIEGVEFVVGDACEGWNPTHDAWRAIVNAGVELARWRTGTAILDFDFQLFASPVTAAASAPAGAIILELDEDEHRRKLASAASYKELHAEVHAAMSGSVAALIPSPELAAHLESRLGAIGPDAYRVEVLRPVSESAIRPYDGTPGYEMYGEMMVAAGKYRDVIRYETHLKPVVEELREYVAASVGVTTGPARR
jgi:hypothetical protein